MALSLPTPRAAGVATASPLAGVSSLHVIIVRETLFGRLATPLTLAVRQRRRLAVTRLHLSLDLGVLRPVSYRNLARIHKETLAMFSHRSIRHGFSGTVSFLLALALVGCSTAAPTPNVTPRAILIGSASAN